MLRALAARLPRFIAALWWGSLTSLGFVVVPLLFKFLPTPAMAGNMAAHLFTAQTWLSIGCAFALLVIFKRKEAETQMGRAHTAIIFIVAGLLLAMLVEFGVAPRIVARQNLALWHALGSAMFLGQWLCAGVVLWRVASVVAQQDSDKAQSA